MRIQNPTFTPPPKAEKDQAAHEKHAAAIVAEVKRQAAREAVSFDEIRAALGVDARALPDGAIHQAALDAGLKVSQ